MALALQQQTASLFQRACASVVVAQLEESSIFVQPPDSPSGIACKAFGRSLVLFDSEAPISCKASQKKLKSHLAKASLRDCGYGFGTVKRKSGWLGFGRRYFLP